MPDNYEEERDKYINSITVPDRPKMSIMLIILAVVLAIVALYFNSIHNLTWFLRFIIAAGLVLFYDVASYCIDRYIYNNAVNHFDEYKKQMIKNYDNMNRYKKDRN